MIAMTWKQSIVKIIDSKKVLSLIVTPEYVVVIESVGHVHSTLLNMRVLFLPKI